jgi:tetratricopeptide (TPR) repeat protein
MNKLLVLLGILVIGPPTALAVDTTPVGIAREAFDLRLAGEVDEAVRRLEAGLAADSTQAALLYELSRTRMFLMDFAGMQSAVGKAVALAPDNADYHYFAGMATAYSLINAAHQGREEQMKQFAGRIIEELESALRCDPDHHEARCMLVQQFSVMAEDMGWDMARAEEHVRILEGKDPVMGAKARANLTPEDQKALLWERVVAENAGRSLAWYEGGVGFFGVGNMDRAAECVDKALAMDPERNDILLGLSTAFAMAGDLDRAGALVRRYLEMGPPLPLKAFALARLGQLEQRKGNLPEGEKLVNEAMVMDPHLWRGFMPPPSVIFVRP